MPILQLAGNGLPIAYLHGQRVERFEATFGVNEDPDSHLARQPDSGTYHINC